MDRLDGLGSLTELNLRRNQVSSVKNVSGLTSLCRFFLSKNQISSFDSIQTIFTMKSLAELSLDGNPVASNRYYRQYLLEQIKQLRHLDLKKISEEERRISARELQSADRPFTSSGRDGPGMHDLTLLLCIITLSLSL